MCAWQSGGGTSPPAQLAYAETITAFELPNATTQTTLPGLSITIAVPTGVLYCVEFYSLAVQEDSGSTAGERILVDIAIDGGSTAQAENVNEIGGFGDATYIKSRTLTGDGVSHVYTVTVINITTGADGVIVQAAGGKPMYLRLLRLG